MILNCFKNYIRMRDETRSIRRIVELVGPAITKTNTMKVVDIINICI